MKKDCLLKSTYWILEWSSPTAVGYDRWLLSNVLWLNLYSVLGKYSSKLSEYFQMQQRLLKFVMFCATNAVGFHGNMLIIQILLYAVLLYIQYFVFLYKNNAALFSYSIVSGLFH